MNETMTAVGTVRATPKKTRKRPSEMDKHIGNLVRVQRIAAGFSQTDLAGHLGLTFQQVQKYEKGVNRISAGRLQVIARVLEVPLSMFFESIPGAPGFTTKFNVERTNAVLDFGGDNLGHRFVTAWNLVDDRSIREAIVLLTERMAASIENAKE
jgi:transcriptional regulator with XRE-family HTH domain